MPRRYRSHCVRAHVGARRCRASAGTTYASFQSRYLAAATLPIRAATPSVRAAQSRAHRAWMAGGWRQGDGQARGGGRFPSPPLCPAYASDIVEAFDYVTGLKARGVPIVASQNSWSGRCLARGAASKRAIHTCHPPCLPHAPSPRALQGRWRLLHCAAGSHRAWRPAGHSGGSGPQGARARARCTPASAALPGWRMPHPQACISD